MEKLRQTPVKERFPEKRYRLRWLDDQDGLKNYLLLASNGSWDFGWGSSAVYTERDLDELKRKHPAQAALIDAAKEEV